jgi:hypothetical protein
MYRRKQYASSNVTATCIIISDASKDGFVENQRIKSHRL